jgi:hypothetical protein
MPRNHSVHLMHLLLMHYYCSSTPGDSIGRETTRDAISGLDFFLKGFLGLQFNPTPGNPRRREESVYEFH